MLYILLAKVYTLGLFPVYHSRMGFKERIATSAGTPYEGDRELDLLAGLTQWPGIIHRLENSWKGACTACTILLSLSLGFLQIGGVINNEFARTALLASCLFSGTGLMVAALYMSMKSNLLDVSVREKWMKASRNVDVKDSVDFWTCLAMPTSSIAWSIIFCILTMLIITWMGWENQNEAPNEGPITLGGVLLTALFFVNILHIWRAAKLLGYRWSNSARS